MKRLSSVVQSAFLNKEDIYHVRQIIVSTSESHGEGEHKLFKHIRDNPEHCKTAIYGLDADLIMLSLFHMVHCELYVFREAPEFMKLQITMNQDAMCFLNITKLSHSITDEMRCSCPSPHRVFDYVFLCFFLGNDFLPHFPALNIRTNGMQRLLDTYRMCIGNAPHRFLLNTDYRINWNHLAGFVERLAKNEHAFILQEYALRKKWDNRPASSYPQSTLKETEELFQMTPVLFREEEKYINPSELFWEERYYKRLFVNYEKTDICVNYLEGLEWVLSYYTSDCRDWRWKYRYAYPPLLTDLSVVVPKYDVNFLTKCSLPFPPHVQLAYVLPFSQLHLLPPKFYSFLMEKHSELYIQNESKMKFQWSFCRHFWESHVILPEIPLSVLKQWESNYKN
jgi:5'-3' exonuclease